MIYTYLLRSDLSVLNKKRITTYGIRVIDGNCHTVKSIPHIFLERKKAVEFVARCNTENLDPIHIDDVIEDLKYESKYTLVI